MIDTIFTLADSRHQGTVEQFVDTISATIESYNDIIQLETGLRTYLESHGECQKTSFIDISPINGTTIVIDSNLIYSFFAQVPKVIWTFIHQLNTIHDDAVVNIVIDTGSPDITYPIMEAGITISNLIRPYPWKKVFNFGSSVSTPELMIAMCCDEVFVGNFASVTITKADDGATISRYIVPVYTDIVKNTYKYWMNMGLFTQKEVDGIFESEADNSIQLLSDEIKKRLKDALPQE